MNPGEVIWIDFPGVVQTKRRPAVILSSASYHSTRPDVIVGLITSQTIKASAPTDHVLQGWQSAGLRVLSRIPRLSRDPAAVIDCQSDGHTLTDRLDSGGFPHQARDRLDVASAASSSWSMSRRMVCQTNPAWESTMVCQGSMRRAPSVCRAALLKETSDAAGSYTAGLHTRG
jgi:hypothetical protein